MRRIERIGRRTLVTMAIIALAAIVMWWLK